MIDLTLKIEIRQNMLIDVMNADHEDDEARSDALQAVSEVIVVNNPDLVVLYRPETVAGHEYHVMSKADFEAQGHKAAYVFSSQS